MLLLSMLPINDTAVNTPLTLTVFELSPFIVTILLLASVPLAKNLISPFDP